jgi:molecular chaperone GrpE (heat shock protein)
MNKTKFLIWAIVLAVPGAVGLWTLWTHEDIQRQQVRLWRPQVQQATEQYLDSYQKWNALSAEQKNDNPWGQGNYGGPDIRRQLEQNQDKCLAVDIAELADRTRTVPPELACILYGPNWRQQVENYLRDQEKSGIILILSSVCLIAGVLIFVLICTIRLIEGIFHFRKTEQASVQKQKKEENPPAKPVAAPQPLVKKTSPSPAKNADRKAGANSGYFESLCPPSKTDAAAARPSTHSSINSSSPSGAAASETATAMLMTPEPVLSSLSELTEEVSAIRQFASRQQDQMRKLQDGYDWMLIRRFCMRIIRCIDNITDRIEQLNCQSQDFNPHTLEDIRDELVFALESSGVESFKPDIGAAYKGLERYAEAVRQRQPNDQPQRSGTIARILRPGYQYLISENDVKIVRCAQVQLYE